MAGKELLSHPGDPHLPTEERWTLQLNQSIPHARLQVLPGKLHRRPAPCKVGMHPTVLMASMKA